MSNTTLTTAVPCEIFGGNRDGTLVHVKTHKGALPQIFHFEENEYHLNRSTRRLKGESMVNIRQEMPRYSMKQYLLPNELLK